MTPQNYLKIPSLFVYFLTGDDDWQRSFLDVVVVELPDCFPGDCLFTRSLHAETHLGPDWTRLEQMLKPGFNHSAAKHTQLT